MTADTDETIKSKNNNKLDFMVRLRSHPRIRTEKGEKFPLSDETDKTIIFNLILFLDFKVWLQSRHKIRRTVKGKKFPFVAETDETIKSLKKY